jgi:serine/threonine protein kinase
MDLLREWFPRRTAPPVQLLPDGLPPGMKVGSWRVLRKLGSGGAGAVYLVKRRGRSYALKMAVRPEDRRFLRERRLLERVMHPNVVGLCGHGWWPRRRGGFPYLVMEYVEGLPLYEWARGTNPTPRQATVLLAKVARALDALHGKGALHRDVKGDNTLVRPGEQEPVLVDLGAGHYAGATPLTRQVLPPVTEPYLSPEAMAFARAHAEDTRARYKARPADDLYALGVMAHRLLTDEYPFSVNAPRDMFWVMVETWPAPLASQVNPRVPRALADIVQRLLAKRPEERHASGQEVAEALVQAAREGSAEWDEPLFEWYAGPGPASRTTPRVAPSGPVAPGDEEGLRQARRHHREQQAWLRLRRMVRRRSPPRERQEELPADPVASSKPTRPRFRWRSGGGVVLALVLGCIVGGVLLRPTFQGLLVFPTEEVGRPGREVARPAVSPDAGMGAAPSGASTPAPVADATQDKEDTRVKKPIRQTEPGRSQPPGKLAKVIPLCVGLGCASTPEQPRSTAALPPPEECPSGAIEAMAKVDIKVGEKNPIRWVPLMKPTGEGIQPTGVRPAQAGPTHVYLTDGWGELPYDTRLSGQLYLGEQRIYGRFTEAQLPGGGRTFPVCMQVEELGRLGMEPAKKSTPGKMLLYEASSVRAVKRFESEDTGW